jgi:hypothetical protein
MSTVFANNLAIACKKGDSKVIAAFPDVCLTPPTPPAGPIPVPYPDTSFSKDMQSGSKTVQIGGDEVMLKDQSFYATSPLGDEAATNSQGASVVTHVITGKTYFAAWSMDVKFEDSNVDRFSDLTTSNHASNPGATPPIPDVDQLATPSQADCDKLVAELDIKAHRDKSGTGESHHIFQNAFFQKPRGTNVPGVCKDYNTNSAMCIELGKLDHKGINAAQAAAGVDFRQMSSRPTYREVRKKIQEEQLMKELEFDKEDAECIMLKVDEEIKKMCPGITGNTRLRCPGT